MEGVKEFRARAGGSEYPVFCGEGALEMLSGLDTCGESDRQVLVVSRRLHTLYRDRIDALCRSLTAPLLLEMEDGEEEKDYSRAGSFLRVMIEENCSRRSMVIALGGGVVGDFAGFLAALFMRGIPVVQVPTTLLSMVDSSLGGKVAVNLGQGKNIAGAFHQPSAVLADTSFLDTLPPGELSNGLAEICKHGFIGDGKTLSLLESCSREEILTPGRRGDLVLASARFKTAVVEEDEKEKGLRTILNFGHTVGHALESWLGYRNMSHGEAVVTGMVAAIELSLLAGNLKQEEKGRLLSILEKMGLLSLKGEFPADEIIGHMRFDKKASGGKMRFVLLDSPGRPLHGVEVSHETIRQALERVSDHMNIRFI